MQTKAASSRTDGASSSYAPILPSPEKRKTSKDLERTLHRLESAASKSVGGSSRVLQSPPRARGQDNGAGGPPPTGKGIAVYGGGALPPPPSSPPPDHRTSRVSSSSPSSPPEGVIRTGSTLLIRSKSSVVKERLDEMAIVEAEIQAGRVPFYPECYEHPDPTEAMQRRKLARSNPPPGWAITRISREGANGRWMHVTSEESVSRSCFCHEIDVRGVRDRAQLEEEVMSLTFLNHREILRYESHLWSLDGGSLFLMSDVCEKGSIYDRFEAARRNGDVFHERAIRDWMASLLRALDYVHQEIRTSHNNISMRCMMFDHYGIFKLGCFLPRSHCLARDEINFHETMRCLHSSDNKETMRRLHSSDGKDRSHNSSGEDKEGSFDHGIGGAERCGGEEGEDARSVVEGDSDRDGLGAAPAGYRFCPEEDVFMAGGVLLEMATMKLLKEHSGMGAAIQEVGDLGRGDLGATMSLMMRKDASTRLTACMSLTRIINDAASLRMREKMFLRWKGSVKKGVEIGDMQEVMHRQADKAKVEHAMLARSHAREQFFLRGAGAAAKGMQGTVKYLGGILSASMVDSSVADCLEAEYSICLTELSGNSDDVREALEHTGDGPAGSVVACVIGYWFREQHPPLWGDGGGSSSSSRKAGSEPGLELVAACKGLVSQLRPGWGGDASRLALANALVDCGYLSAASEVMSGGLPPEDAGNTAYEEYIEEALISHSFLCCEQYRAIKGRDKRMLERADASGTVAMERVSSRSTVPLTFAMFSACMRTGIAMREEWEREDEKGGCEGEGGSGGGDGADAGAGGGCEEEAWESYLASSRSQDTIQVRQESTGMPKQECLLACGAHWAVGKVRAEQGLHRAAVCHLRAALVSSKLAGRDAGHPLDGLLRLDLIRSLRRIIGAGGDSCHQALRDEAIDAAGVFLASAGPCAGGGKAFAVKSELMIILFSMLQESGRDYEALALGEMILEVMSGVEDCALAMDVPPSSGLHDQVDFARRTASAQEREEEEERIERLGSDYVGYLDVERADNHSHEVHHVEHREDVGGEPGEIAQQGMRGGDSATPRSGGRQEREGEREGACAQASGQTAGGMSPTAGEPVSGGGAHRSLEGGHVCVPAAVGEGAHLKEQATEDMGGGGGGAGAGGGSLQKRRGIELHVPISGGGGIPEIEQAAQGDQLTVDTVDWDAIFVMPLSPARQLSEGSGEGQGGGVIEEVVVKGEAGVLGQMSKICFRLGRHKKAAKLQGRALEATLASSSLLPGTSSPQRHKTVC